MTTPRYAKPISEAVASAKGMMRVEPSGDLGSGSGDHSDASKSSRPWANRFALAVLVLTALLLLLSGYRIVRQHQIPGPFDYARQGFCDFQNGVYFPSLAFSRGLSAYGETYNQAYPVARSIPFFSPVILALHVPFALLPLTVSEVLYFTWMVALIAVISWVVTKWISESDAQRGVGWRWEVFALVALSLVVTRSGQQTIFTGYFTFELVLASILAVHYGKSRPLLSALALVVVSAKPNYVLPIALLMLARGNIKAVFWGGAISASLAAVAFWWILPDGGVPALIEEIQLTQESHRADVIERPVNTWIRIDALAIIAKWVIWDPAEDVYLAVMIVMLLPAALLLWFYHRKFPNDSGTATGVSGGVVLLSSLIAVYHHAYDALIVTALIAALLVPNSEWGQRLSWLSRWTLAGLLLMPGLNYLSSQKFLNAFAIEGIVHRLVTSVNAFALLAAWLALLAVLVVELRRKRDVPSQGLGKSASDTQAI